MNTRSCLTVGGLLSALAAVAVAAPPPTPGTVADGARLVEAYVAEKVFFDPSNEDRREPDGMSIDEQGNVYLSGRGGVWVVGPDGKALGLIPIVEFCANVTFGGDDGKTLYMTCQDKLYSLQMKVRGGQFK